MITKWLFNILIFFIIVNIRVLNTFFITPIITPEKTLLKSEQTAPPPTAKQPKKSATEINYKRYDEKTTFIAGILVRTLPDGRIICDGYICPNDTARCVVDVKSSRDFYHIRRTRTCLNEPGHVVDSLVDIERNIFPGIEVSYHIEQGINGTYIESSGDYSNYFPSEDKNAPVLVG